MRKHSTGRETSTDLLLLNLLVVCDHLPDAVDKATLVVGNEPHEDLLLGGIQQHQHPHLTGGRVGEMHAARLLIKREGCIC